MFFISLVLFNCYVSLFSVFGEEAPSFHIMCTLFCHYCMHTITPGLVAKLKIVLLTPPLKGNPDSEDMYSTY